MKNKNLLYILGGTLVVGIVAGVSLLDFGKLFTGSVMDSGNLNVNTLAKEAGDFVPYYRSAASVLTTEDANKAILEIQNKYSPAPILSITNTAKNSLAGVNISQSTQSKLATAALSKLYQEKASIKIGRAHV